MGKDRQIVVVPRLLVDRGAVVQQYILSGLKGLGVSHGQKG